MELQSEPIFGSLTLTLLLRYLCSPVSPIHIWQPVRHNTHGMLWENTTNHVLLMRVLVCIREVEWPPSHLEIVRRRQRQAQLLLSQNARTYLLFVIPYFILDQYVIQLYLNALDHLKSLGSFPLLLIRSSSQLSRSKPAPCARTPQACKVKLSFANSPRLNLLIQTNRKSYFYFPVSLICEYSGYDTTIYVSCDMYSNWAVNLASCIAFRWSLCVLTRKGIKFVR